MDYAIGLLKVNGKEVCMETKLIKSREMIKMFVKSLLFTTWAIGTNAWAGSALSG
jgi:hypothetical protein